VSPKIYLQIDQPTAGRFILRNISFSDSISVTRGPLYKNFKDINEEIKDFRPYIHRMMELFTQKPEKDWHDPTIYQENITTVLSDIVQKLFSGEERERIEKALLGTQDVWSSVPKLNLGIVKLPTPGNKEINDILHNTPLLIECVSSIGLMSPKEAEEIVTQKLENYCLQNSRFQVSKAYAAEVIQRIKDHS
jgi:hypothetical protein